MSEIEKGQTVFIKSTLRHAASELKEVTVTAVGNKYITVEHFNRPVRFHKDTLRQERSGNMPSYSLWTSIAEYDAYVERVTLIEELRKTLSHFQFGKLSTEQLKTLKDFLTPPQP